MAQISDLPLELLLEILGYLARLRDVSSLSRCSRAMHWLVFSELFNRCFTKRSRHLRPELVLMKLVFHAITHDSYHIIRWLTSHELSDELNGLVPLLKTKNITYLHLAIIGDAPRAAAELVKHGTDIQEAQDGYPDVTPLYLSIAHPYHVCNLDGPLRIASTYALPRITEYLLTRGADPNSLSPYGQAAMHLAVVRRLPWRYFDGLVHMFFGYDKDVARRWSSLVHQTVSALLRFGGDPNLKCTVSRIHSCGHRCWRSPDCDHPGQAVLHFASGSGMNEVVNLLLDYGADPELVDDEGYLPVFCAIAHDQPKIAMSLLPRISDPLKFIVARLRGSTALHVACRFASRVVALALLKRGADANAVDFRGQTPLHEVMGQTCPELQDHVVDILHYLAKYGADPDIRSNEGITARQMAAAHADANVRDMFQCTDGGYRRKGRKQKWAPLVFE